MRPIGFFITLLLVLVLVSCASYKQNLMFQAEEGYRFPTPPEEATPVGTHILPNDLLSIEVFTNNGERIIEPNPELTDTQQNAGERKEFSYLVDQSGMVKLPMIGSIQLGHMTLRQAEAAVQQAYNKFYKETFVIIKFNNKRVIVLGALGGQVIPLQNEGVRLTEVLALGKGLNENAKAHNIKVLRGDQVYQIDLSTIAGQQEGDMVMQSGDIVYVEPIRRPFVEALRDNSSIFGLLISLASLAVVISTVSR